MYAILKRRITLAVSVLIHVRQTAAAFTFYDPPPHLNKPQFYCTLNFSEREYPLKRTVE